MGHPDLIERTIREQLPRIRSYCAAMCGPERLDDALSAAVLDFRARSATARADDELQGLVAKAARSAASARANLSEGHSSEPGPECVVMPELLAARANDELAGEDRVIRQHLSECIICATTFARMRRAEQILSARLPPPVESERDRAEAEQMGAEAEPVEAEVQAEVEAEVEAVPAQAEAEPAQPDTEQIEAEPGPVEAEAEPAALEEIAVEPAPIEEAPVEPAPVAEPEPELAEPTREPEPVLEPEPAPAPEPPVLVKRRRGGLLEAVRKVARNAMR